MSFLVPALSKVMKREYLIPNCLCFPWLWRHSWLFYSRQTQWHAYQCDEHGHIQKPPPLESGTTTCLYSIDMAFTTKTFWTNGTIQRWQKQSEDFLLISMMVEFTGQSELISWKSRKRIFRRNNGLSVKTQWTGTWLLTSRKCWPNGRRRRSGLRNIQLRSQSMNQSNRQSKEERRQLQIMKQRRRWRE